MGLPVTAIVYDAFNRRVYAAIPGSAGSNGNSVAVIDPSTFSVEGFIQTGSDPSALALSDDGQVLWVLNAGAKSFRRIELATSTLGPAFSTMQSTLVNNDSQPRAALRRARAAYSEIRGP